VGQERSEALGRLPVRRVVLTAVHDVEVIVRHGLGVLRVVGHLDEEGVALGGMEPDESAFAPSRVRRNWRGVGTLGCVQL
jgi:hypothetical protein